MNCTDFEARLNAQLEASSVRQAPDLSGHGQAEHALSEHALSEHALSEHALAEHAAHCETCSATWEGFRQLSDCIGVWRQETHEADLAHAVVFALNRPADPTPPKSTVESRRPTISKSAFRKHSPAVAGAAALLIAAALLPLLRRASQVAEIATGPATSAASNEARSYNDNDRPVQARSDHDRVNRDEGSPPGAGRPPETDGVPYYELAQRAAGALGQITMLVSPAEATLQKPAPQPPADAAAGWIDDFEHKIEPVGRSLGNAFDFLWRAGEAGDG